jgi:hypothetical protein
MTSTRSLRRVAIPDEADSSDHEGFPGETKRRTEGPATARQMRASRTDDVAQLEREVGGPKTSACYLRD